MRLRVVVTFALLALAIPTAASAQQAGASSVEDRVMGLLTAYDQVPRSEAFTSLGPGAQDVLVAVAKDESQQPFVRGRAAWALGWFPNDTTRTTLEGLLDQPELDPMILKRVLWGLAQAFGQGALGRVRGYIDDGRDEVREAAATALGRIGGDEALRVLQRRLGREESEPVRDAIRAEIARIEGTAASGQEE